MGLPASFIRAQVYVAPEVLSNTDPSTVDRHRADVYSLGVILLEMLAGHSVNVKDVRTEMDNLRSTYPGLSRIVEEMLDPEPKTRCFRAGKDVALFSYVRAEVCAKLEVYDAVYLRQYSRLGVLLQALDLVWPSTDVVRNKLRELLFYRKKGEQDQVRRSRHLLFWASSTQIVHLLVVVAFGFALGRVLQGKVSPLDALPGMAVALSFSLVQVRYYESIFACLDAREVSRTADRTMRLTAVSFGLPVLYTLVLDFHAWPLCSAIGVFIVALNNYENYRVCITSATEHEKLYGSAVGSKTLLQFATEYKGWWEIMMYYGVSLLVVGLLLRVGWAHDEIVYAGATLLLNLKMYVYNTIRSAPKVRSHLEAYYSDLERIRSFRKMGRA